MKKFIAIVSIIVVVVILFDTGYYRLGLYIDFHPQKEVATFIKTEDDKILLNKGNGYKEFEIKGVNMGS